MNDQKRKIAVLGSTGSIGTQALDVISRYPDRFEAYALVANISTFAFWSLVSWCMPVLQYIASQYKSIYEDLTTLKDLRAANCLIEANLKNFEEDTLYQKVYALQIYIFEHSASAL